MTNKARQYLTVTVLFLTLAPLLLASTASGQWATIPGKLVELDAGGGTVWGVGPRGQVYKWKESAFTWQNFGGTAERIAVDSSGTPWVINQEQVYRLRGQNWQNMPGKCGAIASGGGTVWCVGQGEAVYKWMPSAFSWQNYGGKAEDIAVDSSGTPWVIHQEQVYRLRGQNWQNMPGKCDAIASGGGTVWCVGQDQTVYEWNGSAFSWMSRGGKANHIAVTDDGTAWVIEDGGAAGRQVYRFKR